MTDSPFLLHFEWDLFQFHLFLDYKQKGKLTFEPDIKDNILGEVQLILQFQD